ncbi:MAG: protein kinase [Ktedonobacteraceae bacterium]|nr:protein kinase [Ktedonobacteraceae bacterium]
MPQRDHRSIGGLYRTGQVVATSSMFTTYTAYDSNTNDVVGLYVIEAPTSEQVAASPSISQFLAKRQSIQSIHIVKLHNWGIEGKRIYIATDPPRGVTLQHVLNTENIGIPRALDLCKQLAGALPVFHSAGIAGLDLRPLLITVDTIGITDRVQIDDIGLRSLLKSLNYVSDKRQDDIGFLDPRYAPPEYIQSGSVGPWSDIYQVGILLFLLITGRLPFTGRTVAETGILQATNPVPHMSQYVHGLPEGLQEIVEHCMEKDPARRFSRPTDLVAALEKVQPTAGGLTEQTGVVPTREMSSLDIDVAMREAQESEEVAQSLSLINIPTEFGVYAYLTYEKKGKEKKSSELQRIPLMQKSVIVGRTDPKRGVRPDVDLSLFDPDMTVSRLHARIKFEGSFFYIEDLKSRNKTRLGALVLTPMKPELLQHEDTIHFGRVRLRFQIPGMGPVASVKKEEEKL